MGMRNSLMVPLTTKVFTHTPLFAVKFYMVCYGGIHFYTCFAFRANSNNAFGKWQYPSGCLSK